MTIAPSTEQPSVAELVTNAITGGEPVQAPSSTDEAPKAPERRIVSLNDEFFPDDFEHGFFRGKPVAEIVKSFRATETAMQKAQREANERRAEAEQLRADVAARDLALQMAAEARQPRQQIDPLEGIDDLLITNPRAAFEKMKEAAKNEVRQEQQREFQKFQQDHDQQTTKERLTATALQARDQAFAELSAQGVTKDQFLKRQRAILAEITNTESEYGQNQGPLVAANYVQAYKDLFGDPSPAQSVVTPPPAPMQSAPPGSKTVVTQSPTNAGLPTLSQEKKNALAIVTAGLGIDQNEFLKRYAEQTATQARK